MVMGGTIGAGIFFKNKTLSQMAQGDFGIVLATWGVGITAMLALALALVEVTSAQKSDKGIIEWVKMFCPRWFYHSSSNYIKWIFVPITLFTIPVYLTNALEDAGLFLNNEEIYALLFSFAIFVWFMLINLVSLKLSEVSQWIFTLIQTIPLIVFPIYGFINAGDVVSGDIWNKELDAYTGLTGISPWFATIAGISAIAFAYDGFYASASLRNGMKDPHKIGIGLAGGVIGVSIVYLFLTLGMGLAGDGAAPGLAPFMSPGVYKMLNAFIAIGIMGVVNTYAMSSPRQFRDAANSGDSPEVIWLQKKMFKNNYSDTNQKQRYWAAWSWIFLNTTFLFLILGPIGAYAYNLTTYGSEYAGAHIYSFSDMLTNFTSLLVFIILAIVMIGALINRKTQKIKVVKSKIFIPSAIIAITINLLGGIYMVIEAIVGLTGYNNADVQANLVNLLVFLAILLFSIGSGLFTTYHQRKKVNNVVLA